LMMAVHVYNRIRVVEIGDKMYTSLKAFKHFSIHSVPVASIPAPQAKDIDLREFGSSSELTTSRTFERTRNLYCSIYLSYRYFREHTKVVKVHNKFIFEHSPIHGHLCKPIRSICFLRGAAGKFLVRKSAYI